MKTLTYFTLLTATAALSFGQNPLSTGDKVFYGMVVGNVVAAAEKMPEASYNFKPTPEVRSFGELVGMRLMRRICSAPLRLARSRRW